MDYESALARARAQAQRVLGDRASAEDVASEAVFRIIFGGSDPQHLGLIVHGIAVDEYRRRSKEFPAGDAYAIQLLEERVGGADLLASGSPLTLDDVEFRADFDRAVRGLDDPERDAFILTDLRGLTVREAADVLDTSYPTVHRRAERARITVRKELHD